MIFDTQFSPVKLFSSDSVAALRLVVIGTRMQQMLNTEELAFPQLFETEFSCSNLKQLATACEGVHSIVVIADLSNPLDFEVAESIAAQSLSVGNQYSFLVNIGVAPTNAQSAFSSRISMCNGYRTELLDALVDGLIRIQVEPGWVGIDVNDIDAALESIDKNVFAAIGFASGTDPGKAAAQAAINEMLRSGIDIADAVGAAVMIVLDGAGLTQVKAAMALIRESMGPDVPLAVSCHPGMGRPHNVGIALIVNPRPIGGVRVSAIVNARANDGSDMPQGQRYFERDTRTHTKILTR